MLTKQPYEVGKQKCDSELVKSKTHRGLCGKTNLFSLYFFTLFIVLLLVFHFQAMKEPPTLTCTSKDKSARRFLSGRKKKSHDSKRCTGSDCLVRRAMSEIQKVEDNDTDSKLKKVYNLITINVFH